MVFVSLGRLLGLGAVGGAAYTAGYAHKQTDVIGDWKEGMSSAGKDAAEGLGALVGAAATGWQSQTRASPPPPTPMITHVYHDKGSERSTVVTVLVLGGVGVTGYWVLCWYKGWDFFGMSHAKTQELISSFQSKFQEYTVQMKDELARLKAFATNSQEAQKRQEEMLKEVDAAVKESGAHLEDVGYTAKDIADAMARQSVSQEAQHKQLLTLQYCLGAFASGTEDQKQQALRMLEQSMGESLAALPSVQMAEAEQKRIANGNTRPDATGSSSYIVSALQRGSEMVSAPVKSITSFFWGSPDSSVPPSSPTQPQITSAAAPQPGPSGSNIPLNGTTNGNVNHGYGGSEHAAQPDMPPVEALRGFGPGGRIPRDSANDVQSPSYNGGQRKNRATVIEEVGPGGYMAAAPGGPGSLGGYGGQQGASATAWGSPRRGGAGDRDAEEDAGNMSFTVKKPGFF